MTLKRSDAIDLEIIDEKYQTNRMLTLAQKEFRHKNIIEAVSILHSAIEKHLFVSWYTAVYLKFGKSPFQTMKGNYNAYLGYKELSTVLFQIGLIDENIYPKLMKFNALRNEVIHEMMKLESVRKKKLKLCDIKKEFQNGIDCYKDSKKIKDKHMHMLKLRITQGQKKLEKSLKELDKLSRKHGISI